MAFFVRIPRRVDDTAEDSLARSEHYLNLINGDGTLIQRELRRKGYAGYEPSTAATMCAVFQLLHNGEVFPTRADGAGRRLTFFDVGANGGLYAFLCKCLFRESAEVAAFEPAPDTFAWLEAINQANRLGVRTENVAVSDAERDVTLYLSAKSDASNSLNQKFKAKHKGAVTVSGITLDRYCATTGITPTFLKIDVETHEEQVLRGAEALLREHHPPMILEAIHKAGTDFGGKVSEYLGSVGGYRYYNIEPNLELSEHDRISADPGSEFRDWLVSPIELPTEFHAAVRAWGDVLSECTPKRTIAPPRQPKPKPKPVEPTRAAPSNVAPAAVLSNRPTTNGGHASSPRFSVRRVQEAWTSVRRVIDRAAHSRRPSAKPGHTQQRIESEVLARLSERPESGSTEAMTKFLRELIPAFDSHMVEIGFNSGFGAAAGLEAGARVTSFDWAEHDYVYDAKAIIDQEFPGRHSLIVGHSQDTLPIYHAHADVIFVDGDPSYTVRRSDVDEALRLASPDTKIILSGVMSWRKFARGIVQVWEETQAGSDIEVLGTYCDIDGALVQGIKEGAQRAWVVFKKRH